MEYRTLGRSGLHVSPICLGTMMFGGATGERAAGRIVGRARDAGVNFIDTADVYSKGACERVVGKLIRRDRERWVLATKVGNTMGPDPHQKGLGRKWISRAIDASLKRLGTDYVDIYYLHLDDPETPLEETIATLGDLIRVGKVLHWGFSNFRGWRIPEMVRLAERLGVPQPVVAQPYYNALNRMPEVEILPACSHFGVGVVPYAALARGVLTGKYPPGGAPAKGTRA
ncbi:MAG: aldo/keto reductase, partial [Rhodospirillales bacterium]